MPPNTCVAPSGTARSESIAQKAASDTSAACVGVVLIAGVGGAVDQGPADLDRRPLVDQAVFDRLERADRPVERDANLRVFGRGFVGGRGDTDQFGRHADTHAQQRISVAADGVGTVGDDVDRRAVECDARRGVVVERRQRCRA